MIIFLGTDGLAVVSLARFTNGRPDGVAEFGTHRNGGHVGGEVPSPAAGEVYESLPYGALYQLGDLLHAPSGENGSR